jgi:hypothetical protein
MGFRYRKSINVGGLRINASKSGIGASVGVKGLRVTHGVDGKTRVTASIPGTGLSYQETISKGNKKRTDNSDSGCTNLNDDGYEYNNVYITFEGVHLGHYEDGLLDDSHSHLINKNCKITIVDDNIHIDSAFDGNANIHFPANQLVARKEVKEIRGWFSKSYEIILQLDIDRHHFGTEKVIFKLNEESAADEVIEVLDSIREVTEEEIEEENDSRVYVEDDELETEFEDGELYIEATVYEVAGFDEDNVALIVKFSQGVVGIGDEIYLVGEYIKCNKFIKGIIKDGLEVDYAGYDDDVVVLIVKHPNEYIEMLSGVNYLRNTLLEDYENEDE